MQKVKRVTQTQTKPLHNYLVIRVKTQYLFEVVGTIQAATAAEATKIMLSKGFPITEYIVRHAGFGGR